MGEAGGGGGVATNRHSGALVKQRTRNLEIPGSRFARPGMTALGLAYQNPNFRSRRTPGTPLNYQIAPSNAFP